MGYFDKIYKADINHRAKTVYMYLKDHADGEESAGRGYGRFPLNCGSLAPP